MTAATEVRKLTKAELDDIESKLLSYKGDPNDRWYDEDSEGCTWSTWAYEYDSSIETVPGLGDVKVMNTYHGGEGGGEEAELVFQITPEDGGEPYFLHMNGYYRSYDGTTWDGDLRQCKPVQVMVTEYQCI